MSLPRFRGLSWVAATLSGAGAGSTPASTRGRRERPCLFISHKRRRSRGSRPFEDACPESQRDSMKNTTTHAATLRHTSLQIPCPHPQRRSSVAPGPAARTTLSSIRGPLWRGRMPHSRLPLQCHRIVRYGRSSVPYSPSVRVKHGGHKGDGVSRETSYSSEPSRAAA